MKERSLLLARQVSQGREGGPREGGEFAQGGQNQSLRLKYGERNLQFNAFNLIVMSNGEGTTIVGPFPLTLAHPTNQREKGAPPRVNNSKLVTCLLGEPPLGIKFILGT